MCVLCVAVVAWCMTVCAVCGCLWLLWPCERTVFTVQDSRVQGGSMKSVAASSEVRRVREASSVGRVVQHHHTTKSSLSSGLPCACPLSAARCRRAASKAHSITALFHSCARTQADTRLHTCCVPACVPAHLHLHTCTPAVYLHTNHLLCS